VNIDDSENANISRYFEEVCEFIEKARQENKNCLVHCAAGISRSSTLVIAYLMKHQKMNLKEAYGHTREQRSIIEPNSGFAKQLMELELKLFGKNSVNDVHDLKN